MELCRKAVTYLCLGVAAVCLTVGVANAQEVSSGAFTLPRAAELGKHTLPKGSYNYTVRETGMMGAMVTITSAGDSSRQFEMMGLQTSPDASLRDSASTLVVTRRGNGDFLEGIYLADRGVEFTFPVHANRGAAMAGNSKPERGQEITLRIPVRKPTK
jgi:hypothetical protein